MARCAKPLPDALKPVPSSESQLLFGQLAAARARALSSILFTNSARSWAFPKPANLGKRRW